MRDKERSNSKKAVGSPHFLASLALICAGILFYMALSHLSDLMNVCRKLYQMIWPFVMAFVVAWLLNPLVNFFEVKVFKKGKPKGRRALAILVTYLLVIAVLGALLYVVLPQVYESFVALVERIPIYMEDLSEAVDALARKFDLVNEEEASYVVGLYSEALTKLTGWAQAVLPQVVNAGVRMGSGIINVLMALIASIYMLGSKERIKAASVKAVRALIPAPHDDKVLEIAARTNRVFTGFIDGKLVDSLIIGILCLIGTLILRIPFAGLISLIVGVTNIIPFFGPFIGAIPSILILLIVDPWSALWFGIFILALQQLDGNVIGPRILGDSTGVSALGVLVSISIGGSLLGVAGMILGVPVYAVGSVLVEEYLDHRLAVKAAKQAELAAQAAAAAAEAAPAESEPQKEETL